MNTLPFFLVIKLVSPDSLKESQLTLNNHFGAVDSFWLTALRGVKEAI